MLPDLAITLKDNTPICLDQMDNFRIIKKAKTGKLESIHACDLDEFRPRLDGACKLGDEQWCCAVNAILNVCRPTTGVCIWQLSAVKCCV